MEPWLLAIGFLAGLVVGVGWNFFESMEPQPNATWRGIIKNNDRRIADIERKLSHREHLGVVDELNAAIERGETRNPWNELK